MDNNISFPADIHPGLDHAACGGGCGQTHSAHDCGRVVVEGRGKELELQARGKRLHHLAGMSLAVSQSVGLRRLFSVHHRMLTTRPEQLNANYLALKEIISGLLLQRGLQRLGADHRTCRDGNRKSAVGTESGCHSAQVGIFLHFYVSTYYITI